MYERILVPLDGSKASEAVLPPVHRLARKASSELILAQVVEPSPADVGPGFQQESQDFARDYLAQVVDHLKSAGVKARFRVRPGPVDEALLALAREDRVSLIAMATHGRTASAQVPYGGVAERLIRSGPVPLFVLPSLTYPAKALALEKDVRRILVTTDGSDASWTIAPHAADLAALWGAGVLVLHVGAGSPDWLRNWSALYEARGIEVRCAVEAGEDPAATILETAARDKADLIAMSTRGRSGAAERAAGGVTREILRRSSGPLLIARA